MPLGQDSQLPMQAYFDCTYSNSFGLIWHGDKSAVVRFFRSYLQHLQLSSQSASGGVRNCGMPLNFQG